MSAASGVSSDSLFYAANITLSRIDGLLETVCGEMARVPTTVERLSRVDGIVPPGHGFDSESSKEILSIEAKYLAELHESTSHLRASFVLFKEMQDARCKPFEDEASVVVRDIQRQDPVCLVREGGHVEYRRGLFILAFDISFALVFIVSFQLLLFCSHRVTFSVYRT